MIRLLVEQVILVYVPKVSVLRYGVCQPHNILHGMLSVMPKIGKSITQYACMHKLAGKYKRSQSYLPVPGTRISFGMVVV